MQYKHSTQGVNLFGYVKPQDLTYGNPSKENYKILSSSQPYDHLFEGKFKQMKFPDLFSSEMRKQIDFVIEKMKQFERQSNEYKQQYFAIDDDLNLYLQQWCKKHKVDYKKYLPVVNECTGLVIKVKYYFNRPRPFQLANYFGKELYPYDSPTAQSPSLPSGHVVSTKLFTHAVQLKHPTIKPQLEELMKKVSDSRIALGTHFFIDNVKAYEMCDVIINDDYYKKLLTQIK